MKVVGMIQKKGTYEGHDYNNLELHCVYEDRRSGAVGQLTTKVKIKVSNITDIFGKTMSDKELDALIGKEISVWYNRFGNVDRIEING